MDRKDMKKIIKALQQQGFGVSVDGRRVRVYDKHGKHVATIWASREPRAFDNAIARLRKFGFKWPPR